MDTTCLRGRQIQWAQELSCYNFKIDYRPRIKNPADELSSPLTSKDIEKELVDQNRKILDKLYNTLYQNTITCCSTPTIRQPHIQQSLMR